MATAGASVVYATPVGGDCSGAPSGVNCASLPADLGAAGAASVPTTIILLPGRYCPITLPSSTLTIEGAGPADGAFPADGYEADEATISASACSTSADAVTDQDNEQIVTLANVALSGGPAHNGLAAARGIVNLDNVEITDSAVGVSGSGDSILQITRSAILGNSGDGLHLSGNSQGEVNESLIRGNGGSGVAVTAQNSFFTLAQDTIVGNTGHGVSGGPTQQSTQTTVDGSIVAANHGSDCDGQVFDGGANVTSDTSCGFTSADSRQGTGLTAGDFPPAAGGTTPSVLPPSAARGVVTTAASACGDPDQRGYVSSADACDAGSVQSAGAAGDGPRSESIDFGSAVAGGENRKIVREVLFGNGGAAPAIYPTGWSMTGPFELRQESCRAVLFPGDSCWFEVSPAPTAVGPFGGVMRESHTGGSAGDWKVSLTGSAVGLQTIAPRPNLSGRDPDGSYDGNNSAWTGLALHAFWAARDHRLVEPVTNAFQWSRCDASGCSAIDGSTGRKYTPTTADLGDTLQVTMTKTNRFASLTGSVTTGTVQSLAPVAWRIPSSPRGTAAVGQALTRDWVEFHGGQPLTYWRGQWFRCPPGGAPRTCAAIPGATGKTYLATEADVGHSLAWKERASNPYGKGHKMSQPTGTVSSSAATD
jgi:hypothetical protein